MSWTAMEMWKAQIHNKKSKREKLAQKNRGESSKLEADLDDPKLRYNHRAELFLQDVKAAGMIYRAVG
ncbi:MAG: hypothetical protein ACO3LE_07780 [Bdellovibrionota bacterium]